MPYIKSYSNYVERTKHKNTVNGTIFERDITTIGGRNNFAPGQVPVYQSGNFVITINNNEKFAKRYNGTQWERNDSGEIWNYDIIKSQVKDNVSSSDEDIEIKKDIYNITDFAYFGSCSELVRGSINGILSKFPGELAIYYNTESAYTHTITKAIYDNPDNPEEPRLYTDEVHYYSTEDAIRDGYDEGDTNWHNLGEIGGIHKTYDYKQFVLSGGTREVPYGYIIDNEGRMIMIDGGLCLVSNPFGINIHDVDISTEITSKNPLKYFTNVGFNNYEAIDNSGNTHNISYKPLDNAESYIDIDRQNNTIRHISGSSHTSPISVKYSISYGTVEGNDEVHYEGVKTVVLSPGEEYVVEPLEALVDMISADFVPCLGDKIGEVGIGVIDSSCEFPETQSIDISASTENFSLDVTSSEVTSEDKFNIKVYKGEGSEYLYFMDYETAGDISKKYIAFARPKEKFYDAFVDSLDSFEKVLLNDKSEPKYTVLFNVAVENEEGYMNTIERFTFPTSYGGYNLGSSGMEFETYVSRLSSLASFYDERFSDNLYRSLTHEAIKNFDWTYEKRVDTEEEELYYGNSKITDTIRLFGREFDEIKGYADSLSHFNTITYDNSNNLPDYFFTDKLDDFGWDLRNVTPLKLYEYAGDYKNEVSGATEEEEKSNAFQGMKLNRDFYQMTDLEVKPYSRELDVWKNGYFYGCHNLSGVDCKLDVNEDIQTINIGGQNQSSIVIPSESSSGLVCSDEYGIIKFDKDYVDIDGDCVEKDIEGDYYTSDYYKCNWCGYFNKEKFDECPICGRKSSHEKRILKRIKNYSSDLHWNMNDVNNEFYKRLIINSPYILRHKGTIEGVEMILAMFGMKSKRWYDALPEYEKKKYDSLSYGKWDYDISEYTLFTHRIRDPWNSLINGYEYDSCNKAKTISYDTIESKNGEYVPYQGLMASFRLSDIEYDKNDGEGTTTDPEEAYVDKSNGNPVHTRYIYPDFNQYNIYDGNVYYQMNGGWISSTPFVFDNDNNILTRESIDNRSLNKETVNTIKSVEGINELLSLYASSLHDNIIYYVKDLSKPYAIIDGIVYDIQEETVDDYVYHYVSITPYYNTVSIGKALFEDYIIVSTPYSPSGEIRYNIGNGDFNGIDIRVYIMEENDNYVIKAYSDAYSITTFTLFKDGKYMPGDNYTHYFKLNSIDYIDEISANGWQQLSDSDYYYYLLNTVQDDNLGNNPHKGNMSYDNGHEYLTYFRRLFRHSYDSDLFNYDYLNAYGIDVSELYDVGFKGIINDDICNVNYDDFLVEDTKTHYFGNKIGVDGINYEYENEHIDVNDSSKYNLQVIPPYNKFGEEREVDGITNQIINTKRMKITFNIKNPDTHYDKGSLEEIKYIDSIVMPYVEQMIPSDAICEVEYRYAGQEEYIFIVKGDEGCEDQPVMFFINDSWKVMGRIEQGFCKVKMDKKNAEPSYVVKVGEESSASDLNIRSNRYVDIDYSGGTVTVTVNSQKTTTQYKTNNAETGIVHNGGEIVFETIETVTSPTPYLEVLEDDKNMVENYYQPSRILGTNDWDIRFDISPNTLQGFKYATFKVSSEDNSDIVKFAQRFDEETVSYTLNTNYFILRTFELKDGDTLIASGDIDNDTYNCDTGTLTVDKYEGNEYVITYTRMAYNAPDAITATVDGDGIEGDVTYDFRIDGDDEYSYDFDDNGGNAQINVIRQKTTVSYELNANSTSIPVNDESSILGVERSVINGLTVTVSDQGLSWINESVVSSSLTSTQYNIVVLENESKSKRTGFITFTAFDGLANVGSFVYEIRQTPSDYTFTFRDNITECSIDGISYHKTEKQVKNNGTEEYKIISKFGDKRQSFKVKSTSANYNKVSITSPSSDNGYYTLFIDKNTKRGTRNGYVIFKQDESGKEIKLFITQEQVEPNIGDVYYVGNDGVTQYFVDRVNGDDTPSNASAVGILVIPQGAISSDSKARVVSLEDARYDNNSVVGKFTSSRYNDHDWHTMVGGLYDYSLVIGTITGSDIKTCTGVDGNRESKGSSHLGHKGSPAYGMTTYVGSEGGIPIYYNGGANNSPIPFKSNGKINDGYIKHYQRSDSDFNDEECKNNGSVKYHWIVDEDNCLAHIDGSIASKCREDNRIFNGDSCREILANEIYPLRACHEYKTKNTKKGDWYLPSVGEMGCVIYNLLLINNQIVKEKGVESQINVNGGEYWTSTPNWRRDKNESHCWAVDFEHGRIHKKDRVEHLRARPFLQINY